VKKYPHSVLLPPSEYNIVPYMAAADTLISEASSTVFDFLAIGKTASSTTCPATTWCTATASRCSPKTTGSS